MIDFSNVALKKMAIHFVGNKGKDEGVYISKDIFTFFNEVIEENFLQYFIEPFRKVAEFYNFYHPTKIELNEIKSFATALFNDTTGFDEVAEKIALTLYDKSVHPNINGGELFITWFTGCTLAGESIDAVGIYKSEVKDTFIKLQQAGGSYDYHLDLGININEIDKGCIIFNTKQGNDLIVTVLDNINKSKEAKYWMDDFLKLISCKDSFHFTKDYLDVAKKFVTERMPEVFDVSKADKIDYLNKSINYFKKNGHFAEEDFLQDVFQHSEVIDNFNQFKEKYSNEHHVALDNDFDISHQAVKKQAKVFKSILKLDKNFHIYIHGSKDLIEKGTDTDGRKFYKIYYEQEA
ncbi:MAG: nucleoid-associated protein [Ferruginibacter sp.]